MWLREDQFQINVDITGIALPFTFSWTSLEGGDVEANSIFTRPGGMLPGHHIGAPPTRTDATVKRQYTEQLHNYILLLEKVVGANSTAGINTASDNDTIQGQQNGTVTVSYKPLDANGKPISGSNFTHMRGLIKSVQRPNVDANADAAAFLSLVLAMDVESFSSSAGVVAFTAAGFGV